jgi:putative hemolysin
VIAFELIFLLLLILINGILSMSEIAIVSARKSRLEQLATDGNSGARDALELAETPNRLLSTVQIGITLIGILSGAFGGATITLQLGRRLDEIPFIQPNGETVAFILVVTVTTYASLVIGELVPKRLGLQNPERVASLVAPWMRRLATVTSPLVRVLSGSTELILRLLGAKPSDEPPVTEEDVHALLRQGAAAGVFEPGEQQMVEGVFSLDDQRVSALMTPRLNIDWLDTTEPLEITLEKIVASPHSHFPVGEKSLDNIQGVVRAKDLLNAVLKGQQPDLRACIRQAIFVPESASGVEALQRLRLNGQNVAIVISEYGGTEGLLTLHDLLTEITGDSVEAPGYVQRADGSLLVDGLLTVDTLKELLGVQTLPEEENYQTVSGFVMAQLGSIPKPADAFTWEGSRFEVMDMDGRRVDKVLITRSGV